MARGVGLSCCTIPRTVVHACVCLHWDRRCARMCSVAGGTLGSSLLRSAGQIQFGVVLLGGSHVQGLGEQQLWSWDPWVSGCKVPRGVCSVSAGHPTSTQSIRLPAASCPTNCSSPGTSSEGSERPRMFSAKRALRTQGLAFRSLGKFPYSGRPPFYLEKRGPRVSRCAGRGDTHSRTGAEGE